jgi:hypothetical protein
MVRNISIRYLARLLLLPAVTFFVGCGKSDGGPPPGATDDVPELKVDTGSPTEPPASATDAAKGSGKPATPQGDK